MANPFSKSTLTPEALYMALREILREMPEVPLGPLSDDFQIWLSKAFALVQETGDLHDQIKFTTIWDSLSQPGIRTQKLEAIRIILYRCLGIAELKAPVVFKGSFIQAGNHFDAMQAIGKILQMAKSDVLVVDPYMDANLLIDFLVFVPVGIKTKLLADQGSFKPSLAPAIKKWVDQYGNKRPLEGRLTAKGILHDRLIFIDSSIVYILTQSFNKFAHRAHAEISKSDPDTASLKICAYEKIWGNAYPIQA